MSGFILDSGERKRIAAAGIWDGGGYWLGTGKTLLEYRRSGLDY